MTDHTQPTDHLPPAAERADDDERSTSEHPYPVDGAAASEGVSPDTAAEPGGAGAHGLDRPRSGDR
jgi:hypothetical protein